MTPHRVLKVMLMLCGLLAGTAGAELRVSLEPRVIDELGTARLTIRASGTNQTQALDLSALEEDFDVLGTQSASQYRAVNGQVEAWVEYQISLRPRRSGELTVPPVAIGGETTTPIELKVRPVDPEIREAINRMVFFETELSANPVYVQAETVLTRRLYYSSGAQIYSDLPGVPDLENAVVRPLGETRSSTTFLNGQRYGVVEQRFAIFPEQSGELAIPSIAVTSSVRLERNGRLRRSGVRVSTDALTLQVLPIPPEYPADQPWLPATQVTVDDQWDPDTARIAVGEPLTREVQVQVEGNVASVIPALTPALPGDRLRQYPEPADLSDDTSGPHVRGVRQQRYALVPTQPGSAQVPDISVTWWDVNAGSVRTAQSPGRLLRITGTARPAASPPASGATADDSTEIQTTPQELTGLSPPEGTATALETPGIVAQLGGWLVAGAIAVVALIGWIGWLITARRLRQAAKAAPEAEAGSSDGNLRARRRALRAACRSSDPAAMHRELLAFLATFYQTSPVEAVSRFRRDGHGPLLDRLNSHLYGQAKAGTAPPIDRDAILAAVESLSADDRSAGPDALPPLYS